MLRVRLENGELREVRVYYNRGELETPRSDGELEVKFLIDAGRALLFIEKVEELRSALEALGEPGDGACRANDTGRTGRAMAGPRRYIRVPLFIGPCSRTADWLESQPR